MKHNGTYTQIIIRSSLKIHKISLKSTALGSSMQSEKHIVSLCPEAEVEFEEGRFQVTGKIWRITEEKCESDYEKRQKWIDVGGTQYYYCDKCNGEDHEKFDNTLLYRSSKEARA
ncbi:predicted protein [Arabidopsis lyrata subsp. lyrata]|uniref:Predicted protein n=1 Tax=Arabidopsis lyrata subsp. lyrata TaxID=81972 RepID=D7LG49_ARALL|nr:predicted protein [Arabidopsis lyrata subsp. lyrata]